MTNTHIDNFVSAITSKVNSLISSHNSSSSAHSSQFSAKQDTLVSGTNLKTINNNSLLGSGNISINASGGGSNISDYYFDSTNNEIVLEYDSGVTQADIVTSWSNTLSDTNVPSEKLVKNSIDAIGGGTVDSALSSTSENPVQNKVIKSALDGKISTSNTVGLVKNDGSIDTSTYLTSHQSLSNYVQKSSTSGLIKNDGTIDTNTYLTSHQDISNYVQKSSTTGLLKNDGGVDTSSYITSSSLPTASSTTPSADTTSGSYGSGTAYARSNHTHPKSSLYAEASHTHTYSNISNVSYVTATITYTDNSTETIKLLKYTGS